MEQLNPINSEQKTSDKFQSITQITPLSKYLAMTLFVVLPFVGGWIGYQLAIGDDTDIVTVNEAAEVEGGVEFDLVNYPLGTSSKIVLVQHDCDGGALPCWSRSGRATNTHVYRHIIDSDTLSSEGRNRFNLGGVTSVGYIDSETFYAIDPQGQIQIYDAKSTPDNPSKIITKEELGIEEGYEFSSIKIFNKSLYILTTLARDSAEVEIDSKLIKYDIASGFNIPVYLPFSPSFSMWSGFLGSDADFLYLPVPNLTDSGDIIYVLDTKQTKL